MIVPFTMRPNDFSEHGVSMVRFGERRPLLEVELNEVQQNFNKKTAEIVKQNAYSGFLKMNNLDGYARKLKSENVNTFYLTDFKDKIDYVNLDGHIMALRNSDGHGDIAIQLPEPPTSGVEENLVFLEFWHADIAVDAPIYRYGNVDNVIETYFQVDSRLGVETTRRTQLRYRIRVVNHVDFNLHEKGVTDANVRAWGDTNVKEESEYVFTPTPHDHMLFRAGTGDDASVEYFKSVDGYVYSIPLFKVHRRNSSGFTASNPNGGITLSSMSDRPDGLFADVINKNDIVDLRNTISLTGFDYQKLLAQEFDRFLRAETGKKQLSKTYHGLPKTPVARDTIFYADLDGNTNAVFSLPLQGDETYGEGMTTTNLKRSTSATYLPTPTGLGALIDGATATPVELLHFNKEEGEISFLVDFDTVHRYEKAALLSLLDEDGQPVIQIHSNGRHLTVEMVGAENLTYQSYEIGFHYVTLCWAKGEDDTLGEAHLYIDGQLKDTRGYAVEGKPATSVLIGLYKVLNQYLYNQPVLLSDLHISNKCTMLFGALPLDFRQGYAKISPKFGAQRRIYGDAQISQVTIGRVRVNGTDHSAGITKQQVTNNVWAINDKITLKGLGGEIISGVLDATELKVRIRESTENLDSPSPIIKVATTTGLTANKKIRIWDMNLNRVSNVYTISTVNATDNTITLTTPVLVEMGSYIINETFVTSVPIVQAAKSLTEIVTMPGTWTGLGTPNATFNITTIPTGYGNADLLVQYTLNTPSRQKALIDNLDDVYEAEINGELLFPRSTFAITDDLRSKIVGNTTTNPNTMKFLSATTLGNLNSFFESSQENYDGVATLNGEVTTTEAAVTNEIPQRLFTFDLVKIIEQKFKKEIPDTNKIDWIKRNIESIRFEWHGYGLSPAEVKASIAVFNVKLATWNTYASHQYNYVQPLSMLIQPLNYDNVIDNLGFLNFIAYGGKAVNAERFASLNTDYVSIELTLRGRDKHVFLVPVQEEVRKISLEASTFLDGMRVDGVSTDPILNRFKPYVEREVSRRDEYIPNLILIQKNTKRVELLFAVGNEDLQVVTYGSHTPLFEPNQSNEEVTVLAEDKTVLLTDVSTEWAEDYENHHWKDPLYRVRNDDRTLNQKMGFKEIPFTADSLNVNVGALITVTAKGPLNYFTRQYAELDAPVQAVAIAKYLVLHKGEIKLLVCSLHPDGKLIDLDRSEVALLMRVTGNPITKEVEGIKRLDQLPTHWRSRTGNFRGYIDEYGTFVATYQ